MVLKFGTSGLRGLVVDMTDHEVFVNTLGFLDYLSSQNELSPSIPVMLAEDLRAEDPKSKMESSPRIARAAAEGIIDVSKSTQVGLRTYNDSDHGFEILTAPWLHRNGIDAALEIIRERVGDAPLYVSFDVDGMDPAFAPGTGTPVIGGLASWQALELIRRLKGLNLIGMDVVEVSPPYDHAEITALAAATVAHDWLCLLAEAKGAKRNEVGRV